MPANTPRGYTYPLYGDPVNFPAALQDFATDVDTDVAGLVTTTTGGLNRPSARASATANQSLTANTFHFATFATEDYDNAAMVNLGVNNTRMTFTSTGIYLVTAEVVFTSNNNVAVNGRTIFLEPNLNSATGYDTRRGAQTQDTEMTTTILYRVTTPGDFVRLCCYHESGASLNISARSISATKVAN